jgi:hypothetical protein
VGLEEGAVVERMQECGKGRVASGSKSSWHRL